MKNNKSVLIVGNGPSSTYEESGKLAYGCEIARTNWFFLEKKRIYGNKVDYLFHTSREVFLYYASFRIDRSGIYSIKNNICLTDSSVYLDFVRKVLKKDIEKNIVVHDMNIHRDNRIGPTAGLRMLAFFLKMGYTKINITGIDFYQGKVSYAIKKNSKIVDACPSREEERNAPQADQEYSHRTNDKDGHSLQLDVAYLGKLLDEYPDVSIVATSCHEVSREIWSQFRQVKVVYYNSTNEIIEQYDSFLENKWLRDIVTDFLKKYGLKVKILDIYAHPNKYFKILLKKIYLFNICKFVYKSIFKKN